MFYLLKFVQRYCFFYIGRPMRFLKELLKHILMYFNSRVYYNKPCKDTVLAVDGKLPNV